MPSIVLSFVLSTAGARSMGRPVASYVVTSTGRLGAVAWGARMVPTSSKDTVPLAATATPRVLIVSTPPSLETMVAKSEATLEIFTLVMLVMPLASPYPPYPTGNSTVMDPPSGKACAMMKEMRASAIPPAAGGSSVMVPVETAGSSRAPGARTTESIVSPATRRVSTVTFVGPPRFWDVKGPTVSAMRDPAGMMVGVAV
mmetsp:Transcript_33081/g.78381  ORF Transcript_33081/g.78381 Transcript_33081/m.78381 type:complete len:200 (+) Transcript_33081:132-731(+)